MLNTWDLPADCNEGELFTYAETLYDRIAAGDTHEKLCAYLSEVQVDKLEWRSRTRSERLSIAPSNSVEVETESTERGVSA